MYEPNQERMPRISLGPGEVAGYLSNLKTGFDKLGVRSEHFLLSPSKFRYEEHGHFLDGASRASLKMRSHKLRAVRLIGLLYALLVRIAIFSYAVVKYDVFIFLGSGSFFNFLELPILRALNKTIIVVFLGSDARPPIFSGRHLDDEGRLVEPVAARAETKKIYNKVRVIERYADHIINHTATDQFFTREYIRFMAIGLPSQTIEGTAALGPKEYVRIVHAPSRPIAKGTPIIREVIADLRAEGFAIEFIELVGVPNQTVLREIANCDFIIDELYSDTPMGMFAIEAAAFGKPTVVGGHYATACHRDNPDASYPPSLFVPPEDIKGAIRRLIEDHNFCASLGDRARDFVREQWSAVTVAQRFLTVLKGRTPDSWKRRPQDTCYLWGWGLSQQAWRSQVKRYTERNGIDALFLQHNEMLVESVTEQLASA